MIENKEKIRIEEKREPTPMEWLNQVLNNLEKNRQHHLAIIKQITLEKKIVFDLIRKEKRRS